MTSRGRAWAGVWIVAATGICDWWLVVEASNPHVTTVGRAAIGLSGITITVLLLALTGWLWRYD